MRPQTRKSREHAGDDFEGGVARMATGPVTQKRWEHTARYLEPLSGRAEGEWWATMGEVFQCD